MTPTAPPRLFLLDAYALIYRAYYALIRAPRFSSNGFNTSAIFGFCNTLDEILRKENPDHIAVCFDPPGGHTFRHEAYEDYKAGRDKQPEDITLSVPIIKEILEAYHIPVVEVADFEADDVIGTLARKAQAEGFITYMMTPDKDYGQLVDDRIYMYRPSIRGQGFEVRGPKEVCERYGIDSPRQVIDLLALEGDTSDNIPGCPGVGEKTAAKLIQTWGSVENMLDHVADIKGALGRKIADNAEQIKFSKFLATIRTDVPLDLTPADLRRREPDVNRLIEVFSRLEFRNMISRLGVRPSEATAAPPVVASEGAQGSLFDVDYALDAPGGATVEASTTYRTVESLAEVSAVITEALACEQAAALTVTTGGETEAMTCTLLGVALAYGDSSVYIPMPAMAHERTEMLTLLEPLWNNTSTVIVTDNAKTDIVVLNRYGIGFSSGFFDVSLAHYLIAPEARHNLADVVHVYLNTDLVDYTMTATERNRLLASGSEQAILARCQGAAMALRLVDPLGTDLDKHGLRQLFDTVEQPFAPVLASMELTGVRIDTALLGRMSREMTAQLADIENEVYRLAGCRFNIGSPSQVGEVLFGRLNIDPKAKRTKKGAWSTTEDILEKYSHDHPVVAEILRYRSVKKLLATYIDALPKLVNPHTGKIHTTFNQTATATGRISSTDPNLQNIPIRTDAGREIRRAFIPDDGRLMMSADYSQIELRLMAELSGDPTMVEAFLSGEDIHRSTAARIYHKTLEEVTDNERRNAKTANFGIIYGISAFGLSERLGIPRAEAKALIEGYLTTYPGVQQYMTDAVEKARETGEVTTVMGRRRLLPEINSRNAVVRGYAERNAVNAPLQGSAADIIKVAMIAINRRLRAEDYHSRMILQVHDELVFDVVPDELERLKAMVIEEMQGAYRGRVPLEVGVGVGHDWLSAH